MPAAGHLGVQVYIQNAAPNNPSPGDFWFDTSGATVLNFRDHTGNWRAIDIPTAALDTLSNSVSVLSGAVSVISQNISALSNSISVLSNAQSVLSNAVSVISQSLSALSNSVSVLSNNVSVLSNSVSVISNALSALSQVVSVISTTLSALSTAVSVISAGIGGVQMRWVSTVQGISSTAAAGAAISGLSISVAVGIYEVVGNIMYSMSAVDAFGLSFTFPAMVFAAGTVRGYGGATGGGGLAQSMSVLTGAFDAAGSNSIVFSAIMSTISTAILRVNAIFNVSTAGTIQANARVSATTNPANIQAGSFLRAHRLV